MKNIYYSLLFFGMGLFVSGQDLGGTPVEGLIPIKRTGTINQTVTDSAITNLSAKNTVTQNYFPTPTGSSTEVGITEGQLSVSLSGAATYNIPIAVPSGINGVVPQVSLVYNSQGGNGLAGYGWNISGVSAITRIPRTKFHDGVVGGVNLDANDRFALDGQRLIVNDNNYDIDRTILYETENFSNLKVTAIGVSPLGINYGPASFKVEYPDGSVAMYGATTDSRSVTTWGITYWENPQGVRISYTYNLTNNSLSISTIKYGTTGTIAPINEIQFVYKTRQRPEQSYIGGQSILMDKTLSEIKVLGNNVGFRNYSLEHDETTIGYERLIDITEKSGDGTKNYNPTVFSYEDTSETIKYSGVSTDLGISNITSYNAGSISGDFDGDEIMEFIIYPTTGTSSKSKYWFFSEFTALNDNLNLGFEHNVGPFETIFPVSWLQWDKKIEPKQGWAVVKKTDTNYNFTVYSAGSYSPIMDQYERVVNFPTVLNVVVPKKIISGDFNGDGLTDVIAIDNNSTSKKVYFVDLKRDNTSNFLTYSGELSANITTKTKVEVADVNGDGKSDFMIFENGRVTTYTLNSTNQLVLLWNYTDANISIESNKTILLGDYNGDGKMDFIIPRGYGYYYAKYTSTGISFLKENVIYDIPFNANGGIECPGVFYIIPNDFDQDGKTDLILAKNQACPNSQQGFISIANYKNTGTNFVSNMYATTGYISGINPYALPIFLNPDKLNPKLEINFITNNKVFNFQSQKDFSKEKLLQTITTGNGIKESITYKPLSSNSLTDDGYISIYTPSSFREVYPQTDIESAPTVQVVSQFEKQSAGVYKKQMFSYYGAVSNLEGLGFLGFRSILRTNWFPGNGNWYEFNDQIISSIAAYDPNIRGANVANYTYNGFVNPEVIRIHPGLNTPRSSKITITNTRTTTETLQATNSIRLLPGARIAPTTTNKIIAQITPDYDPNASTNTYLDNYLISKSLSFYETSLSPTKVYTLKNTQSNTYNILDNTSSETRTSYDNYNNPTESISKIRNAGVGEQTTITKIDYKTPILIATLTTPYLIGRPESKTQTVSRSGDSMTSKEVYGYGTGTESNLLKTIEKWGNNTSSISEANAYDSFGNITKKTISVAGIAPRETKYEYDLSGRFLTKSTDIEGLSTTFIYDTNNGLLNSETNPYGLTTSCLYDPWFKKTKTTDYLGKSNVYAYSRKDNVNTIVKTTGDDGSYSEELFDDLGRKIHTGIKDLQGNMSYKNFQYDIYDRNFSVSEPHTETPTLWNTTTYDVYGRPITATDFRGKVMSMVYGKLSTTTTDSATGTTKKATKNAMGNLVQMEETPGGIINYSYFANGNLKETNYGDTKISITQDGWGRKTSLNDPSAGTYTYEYNALGESTKETTPNGTTTFGLNAWGKPQTKTIVGTNTNNSTAYTYDTTSKLLTKTVFTDVLDNSNSITTHYVYDAQKRLEKTIETMSYGAVFTKTFTYDAFGRVATEISKAELGGKTSSKTIQNTYKNGTAWQMIDLATNKVVWQTDEINARGQLTKATMGNGIAITNTYDTSDFGYLTNSKHTQSANTVMELSNDFDLQRGNLKWRKNSLFGNVQEDFDYDSQDRLISYPDALGQTVTQTYKPDGRIDTNTLGTYNYAKKEKVYQNTSILATEEAKEIYQNTQKITYNTFKSPYQIEEEGIDKLSFVYNDNNDRSVMFYGGLQDDKLQRPLRKYYSADGSMEIKQNIQTGAIEFVTYLGGDGYSAPIVVKSDGVTQSFLYLHRDYQGSILAITNDTGAVLEKRQFDAWGAIIKVQDGTGNNLNVLSILDRGYTGHEHLQSVGLINMNGRIYDPKLHRFLQPDNFVQDPTNTQNYNRYGYVLNNPLRYSDPTGEFTWSDLVAAVSIVVGTALVIWGGPAGVALGWKLIGSGAAHFLGTFASYASNGYKDWDSASNYIGISSPTISINTGWGDSKPKGVTQNDPAVTPKSDTDGNSGGNNGNGGGQGGGSLPCKGECDGWLGTEYIGPTPISIFNLDQRPVDMVDLAAKNHDAGYIIHGADGISGALFDLSVLDYDRQLFYSAASTFNSYLYGGLDSKTHRPISWHTAGRAVAVGAVFGPITIGKTLTKGVMSIPDGFRTFTTTFSNYMSNFSYYYNQQVLSR